MSGTRKLTTKEVCEYLGISMASFYRSRHRYGLTEFRPTPRRVYYSEAEVKKLEAKLLKGKIK